MHVVRWMIGLSVLGLIPSACGDGFSTSATEGPSLAEIPRYYAKSLCKALNGCTPQFSEIFFGPNDCATLLTKRIQQASLPLFESAVAAGRMKYDASKLQACTSQLEALGCAALDNVYVAACEETLGGTVPIGDECAFDGECQGDGYCKWGGACPGTCTTRELAGQVCRDDAECQPGDKCHDGKCTQRIAEGASCSAGDVGCKTGLVCGADTGAGRTCVALETVFSRSSGESCDIAKSAWCKPGSYCAVTALGLNSSTQSCVAEASSGAACNFSVADMCPRDQFCDGTAIMATSAQIEGTCHLLPVQGEPCTNKADLGKACAADHVCVPTDAGPVCHKLQLNGKDCAVDADCYSESCVDGACAPKADCDVNPQG